MFILTHLLNRTKFYFHLPYKVKNGEELLKAMEREGSGFAFLRKKFPWMSMQKIGPQISELVKNSMFAEALSDSELSAWQSLKSVVTNILENHRNAKYKKEIDDLLKSFCQPGHECPWKCTFCGFTWTLFQRTVEIWMNSRLSTFTKTFALWKASGI